MSAGLLRGISRPAFSQSVRDRPGPRAAYFFEMDDGWCLAFFEVPDLPFEFKHQNVLDLHIALRVDPDIFDRMLHKGRRKGGRSAARSTTTLSAHSISATRTAM
jgi:hypothetical protein